MQLSRNDSNIRFLTDAFPSVDFRLYQSNDPDRFISCFIATFPDPDPEPDAWLEITSLIAVDFQASLTNDFATWNIYLALVFPRPISRHLKYKIESNRFALRKMVLTSKEESLEKSDLVLETIEDMILGNDLKLRPASSESLPFSGSSFVREIISSTVAIPADTKEKSILTRRQHIAELLSRISQP
ncbi:ABC-three component system middle component 1 [Caballeronia sp. LjRoot31]|uniref:ABC-three component system middle component 1 n=1 Tax=Caballeronia sp. LjRoot31 TaxID=3342324 RepID=UPI003ECE10CE